MVLTTYARRSRLPEKTRIESARADRSNNGITLCSTPRSKPKHLCRKTKDGGPGDTAPLWVFWHKTLVLSACSSQFHVERSRGHFVRRAK